MRVDFDAGMGIPTYNRYYRIFLDERGSVVSVERISSKTIVPDDDSAIIVEIPTYTVNVTSVKLGEPFPLDYTGDTK